MKKLVAILILVLILTGCSGGSRTVVCSGIDGKGQFSDGSVTLIGDEEIEEYVVEMKLDPEITGMSVEYLEETYGSTLESLMSSLEGVEFKGKTEGDIYVITLTIDLNKVSSEELDSLHIGSLTEVADYSMDEAIKNFETNGATCKEK